MAETECLVLDIRMPGIDGLELQRRLIDAGAGIPIVFVTAHDEGMNRRRAIEAGALDFLSKPFDAARLVSAVHTAVIRHTVNRARSMT
jgi:FixJ family two-component response regulator